MPIILVVEDELVVREVVAWELEDAGYTVLESDTAEQALKAIREQKVDLLFTDIRLPGMDGWRLAEEARVLRPELPVIYATGYTVEEPRQVPDSCFLNKPYWPSAVIKAAERLGVAPLG